MSQTPVQKIMTYARLPLFLLCLCLANCASKQQTNVPDPAHNAQNSLDWIGTYEGVLPCVDCEGIETKIQLKKDFTYNLTLQYIGRVQNYQESGSWKWKADGTIIELGSNPHMPQLYFVGENTLTQLDGQGQKILGETSSLYILQKKSL